MGMDWSVREGYAWAEVSTFRFDIFQLLGFNFRFLPETLGIFTHVRIRSTVKNTVACCKRTLQRSANEPKREVYLS